MFVADLVKIDLVVYTGYTILLSEKAVSEKPDKTINWPGWLSALPSAATLPHNRELLVFYMRFGIPWFTV